jgi:hypothetical protein
MLTTDNIEKSAFRPGEYIGYGQGKIWRIKRNEGYAKTRFAWCAISDASDVLYAPTLWTLSDKLGE